MHEGNCNSLMDETHNVPGTSKINLFISILLFYFIKRRMNSNKLNIKNTENCIFLFSFHYLILQTDLRTYYTKRNKINLQVKSFFKNVHCSLVSPTKAGRNVGILGYRNSRHGILNQPNISLFKFVFQESIYSNFSRNTAESYGYLK